MLDSTKIPCALLIAGLLGIGWCLSDSYRVRASMFEMDRLTSRADVEWSPAERPAWHAVDPPHVLAGDAPLALRVAGDGATQERSLRLLKYVAELGGPRNRHPDGVPLLETDDPGEIIEAVSSQDYRGNCAHFSTIFKIFSQAAGIESRLVGVSGERWIDGSGHALTEVYLPETDNWMVVDPFFHATFEGADSRPLSLLELRDLLLEDRSEEVRVTQGEIRTGKTRVGLVDYYKQHIIRVVYPGDNNPVEARKAIYGSWLARTVHLAKWPRPLRRAMENTFWNLDRRFIYVDRPEIDDRFVPFYVYRASWALVFLSPAWLGLRWSARRRRRARGRKPVSEPIRPAHHTRVGSWRRGWDSNPR